MLAKILRVGAMTAFVWALVAPVLVFISYDGLHQVNQARAPILTENPADATFYVADDSIYLQGRWIGVSYLVPLSAAAPLPPGVVSWPQEGQALVSPALASLQWKDALAAQFGTIIGEIGPAGVAAANELMVYARPAAAAQGTRGWPATGFGGTGLSRGIPDVAPLPAYPYLFVAILLVTPAIVLLLSVRSSQAQARYRTEEVLRTCGGTWRYIFAWNLRSEVGVVTAATLVSGLGLILVGLVDVRPPFMAWTLTARFIGSHWPLLALAWLTAVLLAVLILQLPLRRQPALTKRRTIGATSIMALVCLVAVVLVVNLSIYVKALNLRGDMLEFAWSLIYLPGAMVIALLVRPLARWIIGGLSSFLLKRAWATGSDRGLIAYRDGGAHTAIAPAAAFTSTSLIACVIVAYMGVLSASALYVQERDKLIGDRFAVATLTNVDPMIGAYSRADAAAADAAAAFAQVSAANPGLHTLVVNSKPGTSSTRVIAAPQTLAQLGYVVGQVGQAPTLDRQAVVALGLEGMENVDVIAESAVQFLATLERQTDSSLATYFFHTDPHTALDISALRAQLYSLAGSNIRISSAADTGFRVGITLVAHLQ